jgi:copper homeostasis protein
MSQSYLFELCADSLEAARAAQVGGADRMELCEDLAISGVTPSPALLRSVLDAVSIPVHVLIRPRGGDFVYSDAEIALMRRQIEQAKAAGASGVAVGILLPDGRIDAARTRELAELARPMHVTFHRAFDETGAPAFKLDYALEEALEDVIDTGADTLLTSGRAPNVLAGAEQIGRLQALAGERLEVMAGGGLKLANLADVVRRSGVTCLHGSLSRMRGSVAAPQSNRQEVEARLEQDLREAIRILQQECLEPAG